MKERRLPPRELPADDQLREAFREPLALPVRRGADAAHLAQLPRVHPFARYRDEAPVLDDTVELAAQ